MSNKFQPAITFFKRFIGQEFMFCCRPIGKLLRVNQDILTFEELTYQQDDTLYCYRDGKIRLRTKGYIDSFTSAFQFGKL